MNQQPRFPVSLSIINSDADAPKDLLPHEVCLERLLRGGVSSDEQVYDYGVSQALRGLLFATKKKSTPLSPVFGDRTLAPLQRQGVRVRGAAAVLYNMCVTALMERRFLACLLYVSVRMLCDAASRHGEGNERPCCTEEWSEAFLSFPVLVGEDSAGNGGRTIQSTEGLSALLLANSPGAVGATADDDRAFKSLCASSRRFQMGYFMLVSGTMRMVANGHVSDDKSLLTDYQELVLGMTSRVLPAVARLAERTGDGGSNTDASSAVLQPPSRVCVEANNFIIQTFYWIAIDVLNYHQNTLSGATQGKKGKKGKSRVLCTETAMSVWPQITLFRSAIQRALGWIRAEVVRSQHQREAENADSAPATGTEGCSSNNNKQAPHAGDKVVRENIKLLENVSALLERVFRGLITQQQSLEATRLEVSRRYGTQSRDYGDVSEVMWVHTVRLAVLIRSVAGSWVMVHGGLGVGHSASGLVASTEADVVSHIGGCVVQVPSLADHAATDGNVFVATQALLGALVAVAAAAPSRSLRAALWEAAPQVTQQIHSVIVQRALSYRDETVLQMGSMLSGAIVYTERGGGASQFAAQSADQLLSMLAETRDAASHCVVEMLCQVVVHQPQAIVPPLFRLLEHGSPAARRNALDVLSMLPNMPDMDGDESESDDSENGDNRVAVGKKSASRDGMREVLRLVADNLLLRLKDEELCVRMQGAALFAKVHPEDVVRPLLHLSLQRDDTGRKRAAAMTSLKAVLSAHTEGASVLLLLFRESADVARELNLSRVPAVEAINDETPHPSLEEAPSPASSTKAAPRNPGDIFTKALLYSSNALGEGDAETATEEEIQGTLSKTDEETLPSTPQTAESRLARVVQALCEHWVSTVTHWTSQDHFAPLLHLVVSFSRAGREQTAEDETYQRWVLARVKSVIAAVTTLAARAAEGVAAARALFEAFNSEVLETSADGVCGWKTYMEENQKLCLSGDRRATFRILLPLLLLHGTRPDVLLLVQSTECDGEAASEGALLVDTMWSTFSDALMSPSLAAFFAALPNAQRLLIEVVCLFPPEKVLNLVTLTPEEAQGASPWDDRTTTSNNLFAARVLFFAVSFYASYALQHYMDANDSAYTRSVLTSLLGNDSSSDKGACGAHMAACEKFRSVCMPLVLGEADLTEPQKKLVLSSVDTMALLGFLRLAGVGVGTHEGEQTGSALFTSISSIVLEPLTNLRDAYKANTRNSTQESTETLEEKKEEVVEEEGSITSALAWFEVSIRVAQRQLEMLRSGAPFQCRPVLLSRWIATLSPALISLANAACAGTCSGATHGSSERDYRVAMQCADTLFRAIMLSATIAAPKEKAGDDSTGAHAAEAATGVLSSLPLDDRSALVSFAIGCARFNKSPPLQFEGVKLISALLGADPALLVEAQTDAAETSVKEKGGTLLDTALTVLRSTALMHPLPQARALAEQILHSIQME